MYSESDIEGAVVAGAISPQAAAALRAHIAVTRDAPAVDEESFRLLTGFNDIFVSIAIALLLVALAQIGSTYSVALGGAAVAGASWLLGEYFTRRRRMALPSILLLLGFTGGVAATLLGLLIDTQADVSQQTQAIISAGIGLLTAGAAWLHWRRFMVPITIAAGAVALVGTAVSLVMAAVPATREAIYPILLAAGLAVFALAMWWDLSDSRRLTRRADVAFWLHLAAAPMIAHSVFQMLGVFDHNSGVGMGVIVLALYLLFGFIALAIDRRALLVSSLVYVLYAMYAIIRSAGAVELGAAITGLIIGSALLVLSAFWHRMRGLVVGTLGDLGRRLPPVSGLAMASA
ncbi:hypothetical protein ACFOKI_03720 [Sphingomonas qilianensis]|uniref:DUF2157 domain-containing protein n=1 Tax=Sphingomonas qilianensis TaxID=1736690 RepID=A0ABU9XV19_9SPHN